MTMGTKPNEQNPYSNLRLTTNWRESIFTTPIQVTGSTRGGRLGVNFMDAESVLREVCLPLHFSSEDDERSKPTTLTLKITQTLQTSSTSSLGVGAVVWDAGILLSSFLTSHPRLVKGKHVLDLGSGTGICGIVAGWLGAEASVLSDIRELEGLCNTNITDAKSTLTEQLQNHPTLLNSIISTLNETVFHEYWWGASLPPKIQASLPPHKQNYDILLASDDLYDSTVFPFLKSSLQLIVGDETVVVFSYKRRMNEREVPFFEGLCEFLNLYVVIDDGEGGFGGEAFVETYIVLGALIGGTVDLMLKASPGPLFDDKIEVKEEESDADFLKRMEEEDAKSFKEAVDAWRIERNEAVIVEKGGGF